VLTWLLAYANDKLRPHTSLRKGALITTGTLCGAIELKTRGRYRYRPRRQRASQPFNRLMEG
jgi:hypothetical protein